MSEKLLLIDSKMNTVEIEMNHNMLKLIGVNPEEVKKHKSRRQLMIELSKYLDNFTKID